MTVANEEVMREVPVMPGGRRVLGHALEFGRPRSPWEKPPLGFTVPPLPDVAPDDPAGEAE
jgi:hypothetical protein